MPVAGHIPNNPWWGKPFGCQSIIALHNIEYNLYFDTEHYPFSTNFCAKKLHFYYLELNLNFLDARVIFLPNSPL